MSNWDLIVERKIQEAMQEGAFENLSGKGAPLPKDENPYEDPSMRMSYRLLKNNGFSLPWIEEAKNIDAILQAARKKLMRSWLLYCRPSQSNRTGHRPGDGWRLAVDEFNKQAADLNRRINSYNLTTPSNGFHRLRINAEREIDAIIKEAAAFKNAPLSSPLESQPKKSSLFSFLSTIRHLRFKRPDVLKTALMLAVVLILTAVWTPAASRSKPRAAAQTLIVRPVLPVAVAPNQPEVMADSTKGIINAVCQVKLNVVGCGFSPDSGKITCDTNGDGVPELMIPLTDIVLVNKNLVQAVAPAQPPQLGGTPFPLSCCGGTAALTFSRTLHEAPDNVFGEFTISITCPIDLGERAPVVISASPSGGDCATGQNLLLPGSCFLRADGTPNVTSVFAVEKTNPSNVIQSSSWALLNPNLIDAFFQFGQVNAGKTFLIFVSGPTGTSRNLLALPAGAAAGCPIGNEQGIQVTFSCQTRSVPPPVPTPPVESSPVLSCSMDRSSSGSTSLVLITDHVKGDAIITVGGIKAKKMKFMDPMEQPNTFGRVVLKGKVCKGLPGMVVVSNSDGVSLPPFQCNATCTP